MSDTKRALELVHGLEQAHEILVVRRWASNASEDFLRNSAPEVAILLRQPAAEVEATREIVAAAEAHIHPHACGDDYDRLVSAVRARRGAP